MQLLLVLNIKVTEPWGHSKNSASKTSHTQSLIAFIFSKTENSSLWSLSICISVLRQLKAPRATCSPFNSNGIERYVRTTFTMDQCPHLHVGVKNVMYASCVRVLKL